MRDEAGLRVAIVDDEPPARKVVRSALERDPTVEIVAECGDGEEAVEAILGLRPDVVFLDVQMPGLDGFDVIEQVGFDEMPAVVFVTAYDRYSLRAFEVHALDYVLKPFEPARLRNALRHVRKHIGGGEARENLATLLGELRAGAERADVAPGNVGPARRFMVKKARDRFTFIAAEDIDWIGAQRNYVQLHVAGEMHLFPSTLKDMLHRLDPSMFVQIHRSTIVNLDRVREVQPWFSGDYVAILEDGHQLRVSRNYRDNLLRPTS